MPCDCWDRWLPINYGGTIKRCEVNGEPFTVMVARSKRRRANWMVYKKVGYEDRSVARKYHVHEGDFINMEQAMVSARKLILDMCASPSWSWSGSSLAGVRRRK